MKLEVTGKLYFPSESMCFQGTQKKLEKKLKEGYYQRSGSNGSYILVKPAEAKIFAKADGREIVLDASEEIKRIYNVGRVSEKRLDMLVESIQSGKKEAFYTKEGGLRVEPKAE